MSEKGFKFRVKALSIFVASLNYLQMGVLPLAAYYTWNDGHLWLTFILGVTMGIKFTGLIEHYRSMLKDIAEKHTEGNAAVAAQSFLADIKKVFDVNKNGEDGGVAPQNN